MISEMDSPIFITIVGLAAGTCTTLSFIPQVVRIWKTHSADDISTGMFIVFSIGSSLWFFYGLLSHGLPVVIANGITLCLSLAVLFLKRRFKKYPAVVTHRL